MNHRSRHTVLIAGITLALAALLVVALPMTSQAAGEHTTNTFSGRKANTGTATHSRDGGHNKLTLSNDFVVPEAPDPHWQVVDSKGRTYLLNRLMLKDDKYNQTITVPDYVHDVAKVQIWCAWAEVVLGEAKFSSPVG